MIGLSLEAANTSERPLGGIRLVAATTGIVPLSLGDSSDPRVVDARAMVARTGAPAGWWTALGHDAAVLAKASVASLPADTTGEREEISRRRTVVLHELERARAPLWTSERQSFDKSHALPRAIRVVPLQKM